MAGFGGGYAIGGAEPALSPWLQELVDQYYATEPARWPWGTIGVFAAVLLIAAVVPLLVLRLEPAAYPAEPERQHALETCSRTDPTFIRFLQSDRDACYRRILISKAPE